MKRILLLFAFVALVAIPAHAQKVVLKNNIFYDVLMTPNLGIEVGLGKRTTIELTGSYNPFKSEDKQWKHWLIQPEFRYWLCERFNSHFFGVHGLGGEYNVAKVKFPIGLPKDVKDFRYDGYYWGAGVTYGYHWILSRRVSLEGTLGLGYIRYNYDKYKCTECSPILESSKKNYFGPTKIGLNIVIVIN